VFRGRKCATCRRSVVPADKTPTQQITVEARAAPPVSQATNGPRGLALFHKLKPRVKPLLQLLQQPELS
jgi:hypothetical protein